MADEQVEQYSYRMSALKPYLNEYRSRNSDSYVVLDTSSDNCFQRCVCFMLVHLLMKKYSAATTISLQYRYFLSFVKSVQILTRCGNPQVAVDGCHCVHKVFSGADGRASPTLIFLVGRTGANRNLPLAMVLTADGETAELYEWFG